MVPGFFSFSGFFDCIFNSKTVGTKLKQINLPGDCLVFLIARDGKRIIPDGSTKLAKGDVVVMIGSKEYMGEAVEVLN